MNYFKSTNDIENIKISNKTTDLQPNPLQCNFHPEGLPLFTSPYISKEHTQFLFGAACSSAQVEAGITNNQWTRWVNECNESPFKNDHLVQPGKQIDFQKNFKKYIKNAKKMGLTAFRFSIEWSEVKPTKEQINKKALIFLSRRLCMLHEAWNYSFYWIISLQ